MRIPMDGENGTVIENLEAKKPREGGSGNEWRVGEIRNGGRKMEGSTLPFEKGRENGVESLLPRGEVLESTN